MFGGIRATNPKFVKNKRPEFLCLEKKMRTRLEFQGIQGQGQGHNSNVCKDNIRIPMF